jgi:hypothetical protein
LRAGPIAEAGLGVVELCVAAAPLPWLGRILLLLTALSTIAGAHRNLYDERRPGSDGAQIHRIRQQALGPQQPQPRAGDDDPCVTTSVPPPGY